MTPMHQLEPGRPVDLAQLPARGDAYHPDKASAKEETRQLRDELIELQRRHYAAGKDKLLVVFQAMDAGGKDSTIRRVLRGVNPQGVRVTSFKVPSKRELDHDFLWRVHKEVPGKGMIGVFNRSHYEDVLVVRVHKLVPEATWRPRYEQINYFEKMLAETGTVLLKFYLHISKDEQHERFQDRVDDPTKNWKFSFDDLEKRKLWDVGRLYGRLRGNVDQNDHLLGALARHSGRSKMVSRPGGQPDHRLSPPSSRPPVPRASRRHQRPDGRMI